MYIPKHFAVENREWIRTFIDEYRFATLVTVADGEPFATHLPLLYEPDTGANGLLRGHMARANPHWKTFDAPQLAIFTGPHAYVSPTWYETAAPAVPTWNYTAIHAYGKASVVDDPVAVRELLVRLTEREEAAFSQRYTVDGQDEDYVSHMMRQIVAFEIPITRIEAKAKLSQNRTPEERRRVAQTLGGDVEALMKELVL